MSQGQLNDLPVVAFGLPAFGSRLDGLAENSSSRSARRAMKRRPVCAALSDSENEMESWRSGLDVPGVSMTL